MKKIAVLLIMLLMFPAGFVSAEGEEPLKQDVISAVSEGTE